MRHKRFPALLTAAAAFLSSSLSAQTPSPSIPGAVAPQPAPTPRVTLSDALSQASLPDGTLILSTYPMRRSLPSSIPPAQGDTISQIAPAFGLITMDFGSVTTLAYAKSTVFNDNPSRADIYSDMPPRQIVILLAASLDQGQWRLLTGKEGIADVNLKTAEQHAMWAALWSGSQFTYQAGKTMSAIPKEQFMRAHIRLASSVRMRLYDKNDNAMSLTNEDLEKYGPAGMDGLYAVEQNREDRQHGAVVSQEAPNAPKFGDLDFSDARLRAPIAVTGMKTLGALVDVIRTRTGVEVYADQRLERRPLTLAGKVSTAPANDLLRALAFMAEGTYRQVGPATLLTADLVGAGARAQIWKDFERDVEKMRAKPISAASGKIHREHGDAGLPSYDNPLTLSAAQIKNANQPVENLGRLELPFDLLTPGQQAMARRMAVDLVKVQSQPGKPYEADLLRNIVLQDDPVVSVWLPISAKPLALEGFSPSLYDLFRRSDEDMMNGMRDMLLKRRADQTVKTDNGLGVRLKAEMRLVKRRALLAAPRSEKEATDLLNSMATVGFNELWLPSFAEGQAHPDLLKATLRAAASKGIAVYPIMSLFDWGQTAPEEARDVTILGEDSLRSNARWMPRSQEDVALFQEFKKMTTELGVDFPMPDFGYRDMVVSPFSKTVQKTLLASIRDLAATPGIGGIVWRDALPPGYDATPREFDTEFNARLGYTLPARLAFLRKWRVDPIDIVLDQPQARAWPDWMEPSVDAGADLPMKWRTFLYHANLTLLQQMYLAARPQSPLRPRLPIFIQQRRENHMSEDRNSHWFGSWDDPASPPPALILSQDSPDPAIQVPDPATQANGQSKETILTITPPAHLDLAKLSRLLEDPLKEMAAGKSPWRGFALDVSQLEDEDPISEVAKEMTMAAEPRDPR